MVLVILLIVSGKSKSLKYDGIKSIIGGSGENSAGGNFRLKRKMHMVG